MKKLLLVLAIAGFAVACNNDAENKAGKTDSTAVDTSKKMNADTSAPKMDTTAKMGPDTTKKM